MAVHAVSWIQRLLGRGMESCHARCHLGLSTTSAVTVTLCCLALVLNPVLLAPDGMTSSKRDAEGCGVEECLLGNSSTCPVHHCCVKQVKMLPHRKPCTRTRCQPLLEEGEMCLRYPEHYLCDCLSGMTCHMHDSETVGTCKPRPQL